jgi:hypothetical protein
VPGTKVADHIDEILEVDILTFDLLDPETGAFKPDPTQLSPVPIHVLIATPKPDNPKIPLCEGQLEMLGRCAPLMVFRHGLTRGRADMLLVADANAEAGMITVAIDAAKHGDRTLCMSGVTGPTGGCNPTVTCVTALLPGAQGDVAPPGSCGAGGLFKQPVMEGVAATDGIAAASGQYLITQNFFRTRDTLRQDIIDQSQLIHVLAFAPPGPPPTTPNHSVYDRIFGRSFLATGHGLLIDPTHVYFSGQSLGAIQGAMDVAANPRISKAVFNVGGGTIVDVFTNSEAFKELSTQLLAGRAGADLLKFLVVAKTILDPADPINFIGHLTQDTLPNVVLPPGDPNLGKPQAAKRILTQNAFCEKVVPNPFSHVYASNGHTGPLLGQDGFGGPGTFELFVGSAAVPDFRICAPASVVDHGFLTDWKTTLTAKAQSDLAKFVTDDTFLPPGLQHP